MTDTKTIDRPAGRGAWAFSLVVLGSIVSLVSITSTWLDRQALDTDAWVSSTDQLLADDDVRAALSVYLVDQLYEAISVEDAIADLLPTDFDRLAAVVAGAIRGPAADAVDGLLATDTAREIWRDVNRTAHSTLVAIINDDTGDVLSTAGGVVSIDFRALVVALAERVGLGGDVIQRIPEDAGVVVLFESDEIGVVQNAARAVERLSAFLFFAVVALFAGAVYLSGDRRRTVRDCGIGLGLVAVLALIARSVGVDALVNTLSTTPDDEPAASILLIGSSLLRQVALTQLLVAVTVAGFAGVTGPTRVARGTRAFLAPVLRHGRASLIIGGLFVFLLLLWLKPGGPIDGRFVALGIAGLCMAGVGWVQRVTAAEFPDMTYARFGTLALAATRRGVAKISGDG